MGHDEINTQHMTTFDASSKVNCHNLRVWVLKIKGPWNIKGIRRGESLLCSIMEPS
jgi:hypothetical protein